MMKRTRGLALAGMLAGSVASALAAPAQSPDAAAAAKAVQELNAASEETAARNAVAGRQVIPLQIQLIISKTQGDKKISSLPYLLSVNTGTGSNAFTSSASSSLRMGTQVPITTTMTSDGKTLPTVNYRDVGTNIDCNAIARPDGSFIVNLTVSDSSVYADEKTANIIPTPPPVLRNFQVSNRLILKDGQTSEFTAATDPVSGQIIRVSATLRVLK